MITKDYVYGFGAMENLDGEIIIRDDSNIIGKVMRFYSEKHQAIFTHHTRFTHLHIWFESEGYLGHVDDSVITEPWTISFPEN